MNPRLWVTTEVFPGLGAWGKLRGLVLYALLMQSFQPWIRPLPFPSLRLSTTAYVRILWSASQDPERLDKPQWLASSVVRQPPPSRFEMYQTYKVLTHTHTSISWSTRSALRRRHSMIQGYWKRSTPESSSRAIFSRAPAAGHLVTPGPCKWTIPADWHICCQTCLYRRNPDLLQHVRLQQIKRVEFFAV